MARIIVWLLSTRILYKERRTRDRSVPNFSDPLPIRFTPKSVLCTKYVFLKQHHKTLALTLNKYGSQQTMWWLFTAFYMRCSCCSSKVQIPMYWLFTVGSRYLYFCQESVISRTNPPLITTILVGVYVISGDTWIRLCLSVCQWPMKQRLLNQWSWNLLHRCCYLAHLLAYIHFHVLHS